MEQDSRYRRLTILKIGGICIGLLLKDRNTLSLLKGFEAREQDLAESRERSLITVGLDEEDLQLIRQTYTDDIPFYSAEYNVLAGLVSGRLHRYGRAVFHGVSFLWRGRAWILTAPSGTGKTTQYYNLKTLFGDQIRIMNGDKPVLQAAEDGRIIVHPSPWNGKERLGTMETAELAGIIYLEQGEQNRIYKMEPEKAVVPILLQFITFLKNEEQVRYLFRIEETILQKIPVWKMVNNGNLQSTKMLYDTMELYMKGFDKNGIQNQRRPGTGPCLR